MNDIVLHEVIAITALIKGKSIYYQKSLQNKGPLPYCLITKLSVFVIFFVFVFVFVFVLVFDRARITFQIGFAP